MHYYIYVSFHLLSVYETTFAIKKFLKKRNQLDRMVRKRSGLSRNENQNKSNGKIFSPVVK